MHVTVHKLIDSLWSFIYHFTLVSQQSTAWVWH